MTAKDVFVRWIEALEACDTSRMLDLMADDVELRFEGATIGKDMLRTFLAKMPEAYELIRVEPVRVIASEREVGALIRAKAKLRSDVDVLGEKLPTAGKELEMTAAIFMSMNESGKIATVERVRDNLEVARQLGIAPERMQSLLDKMARRLAA